MILNINTIEMQTEKKFKVYSVPKFTHTKQASSSPESFEISKLVEGLVEFDGDYYFRVHPHT